MYTTGLLRRIRFTVRRNRIEDANCLAIAQELDIPVGEVKKVVSSFFGEIVSEARSLPFNNRTRIYTKDKFDELVRVWNIPSIGRIGPAYSRYLKWRGNESKKSEQRLRSDYRSRLTQDDIENIAEEILSGKTPSFNKKRGNEMYNRVWLVGQDGKKLARQVIPKNKEDVI